ncbi:hypothetical protein N7497_006160 [Penicillium chrysogenum]|jgi:hypothetical protein|nr:hypothetical protein N7497_006160 [Penicillium chrysogenum]
MPARRNEREGNESNNASSRPAPDRTPDPLTTRSGLVRQAPVSTVVGDDDSVGESRTENPVAEGQGPNQP